MAQNKKIKWLLIGVLIVLSVLMIIPPLHYHYIYPTAGDDTAAHLIYFQNMDSQSPLYYGQYLIGKLINWLPFDPNVTFLWLNFIVLIMALWAIGLSVGLAVNYLSGILAVLMMLIVNGLLQLFHWGQIFDIVGIAILLPVIFLCLHNMSKGIGWKIGATVSLCFFLVFHVNGRYLFALIPIVAFYEVARLIISRKHKEIGQKILSYRFLFYSGSLGSILILLFFANYLPELIVGRLWLDGAILLCMFIGGVLGLLLNENKRVSIAIVILAILVTVPNMVQWMGNNSAVKDVDKEAISFLNKANGQTYSASEKIAQNVYGLFVNKEFVDVDDVDDVDYILTRTTPQTPGSDPTSPFFENQERLVVTGDGYNLLRQINKGELDDLGQPIVVSIYGK